MQQPQRETLSDLRIETTGMDEIFDVTDATVTAVPSGDKIEVTVTEAADLLDISKRTMWRRIKAGEFASRYDGRQTFVAIPASLENTVTSKGTAASKKKVSSAAAVTSDEVTAMKSELERTRADLVAASNRVQYLQGQVDLFQDHFKLLMDNQHKASWLHRTWLWITKGVTSA
jgi:hypothetical protein